MGEVRNALEKMETPNTKNILLIEMIARSSKKIFNSKLREKIEKIKTTKEENESSCRVLAVEELNLLISDNKEYWKSLENKIVDYFGEMSFHEDEESLLKAKNNLPLKPLYKRIIELLGVKLTKNAWKEFKVVLEKKSLKNFVFMSNFFYYFFLFLFFFLFFINFYIQKIVSDIEGFEEKIKRSNFIDLASARFHVK